MSTNSGQNQKTALPTRPRHVRYALNTGVECPKPTRPRHVRYALFDVADADLLNFDSAATLLARQGAGLGSSLQAQVLAAGLIARTFNINNANDASFVDNFFAAKVEEVVKDPGVGLLPEPSTLAIFGLGLAGLGFMRRRRKLH